MVAEVVVRAMAALGLEDLEAAVDLARQPVVLRTCDFGKHAGKLWSEVPKSYLEWMLGQDFDEDKAHTARYSYQ